MRSLQDWNVLEASCIAALLDWWRGLGSVKWLNIIELLSEMGPSAELSQRPWSHSFHCRAGMHQQDSTDEIFVSWLLHLEPFTWKSISKSRRGEKQKKKKNLDELECSFLFSVFRNTGIGHYWSLFIWLSYNRNSKWLKWPVSKPRNPKYSPQYYWCS